MKKFVSIEFKSGKLFEQSAEPKEGFEMYTSSKGNVSYRKYYKDGISGTLNNVLVRDTPFGQQISVIMEDETFVNINLNDTKGNVDVFAESFIKVVGQLSKGSQVTLSPYNFLPPNEKYNKTGMTVMVNGEKVKGLSNSYYKDGQLVQNDIPAVRWKLDPTGKNKPSAASLEEKNEYLLAVLTKEVDRIKGGISVPQTPKVDDDSGQSLPF